MRKSSAWSLVVLLPLLLEVGCQGASQPGVGDIKAVVVTLSSTLPSFTGAESIVLTPIFKLDNPNDFLVAVNLQYTLKVAGQTIGSAQIPTTYYIPAKTQVSAKDDFVVAYAGWLGKLVLGGKSPAEANQTILPLWKGLGGKMPVGMKEEIWNDVAAQRPAVEGSAVAKMTSGEKEKTAVLSLRWQDGP